MLVYKSYLRLVEFKKNSGIPKYRQLAFAIAEDINQGKLEFGDWLPSIADYASCKAISKNTVIKAYSLLQKKGIIALNPSKRYIVKNDHAAKPMLN